MTTLSRSVILFSASIISLFVGLCFMAKAPLTQAQAVTFMKPPYSGTTYVWTTFDHEYPTLYEGAPPDQPGSVHRDGFTYPTPEVPQACIGYSGHSGIDYRVVYDYVLAAHSGQVVKAGWASVDHRAGLGLRVEIQVTNPNGTYKSRYGHLSTLMVQNNQLVVQGKVIGISGNTGNSTGPHLHFEVQKRHTNNTFYSVNPYGWASTNPNRLQGVSKVNLKIKQNPASLEKHVERELNFQNPYSVQALW